jgi:DNA-binding MarR family transcriptional regulator
VWDASYAFFAEWDLGPSQFNVLNLIHGSAAGLSQSDLSRELIVHRSNLTGLVDRLEKRGLVERKSAAGDRRAYRVVLTPEGARLMRLILPKYYAAAESVWSGISERKVLELTELLAQGARDARAAEAGHQQAGKATHMKARSSHANAKRKPDAG